MKIMGRVLLGLVIIAVFTAGILFAVNSVSDLDTAKKPLSNTSDYQRTYQTQQATAARQHSTDSKAYGAQTDNTLSTPHGNSSHLQQAEQADEGRQNGQQAASTKNKEENLFQTVSEDYFSDAVFIGDSRTVGMQQSGLIPNAVYYAKVGIGIGEILSTRFIWENGMSLTVPEALRRHSFGKVYIMIGINDMSAGDTDWFLTQYTEILHTVQDALPNAIIYIQGNIPMSYYKQDLSGALNNLNLAERNQASSQLADHSNIFYLDIASVYSDDNGHLLSQYTSDGLHVLKDYYPLWADYLSEHAILHEQ